MLEDCTEAQSKMFDLTYKALGRFVVEFSRLLFYLEQSTIYLIGLGPDRRNILIEASLNDRTASPINSAYFSVFFKRWEGQLAQEDIQIMKSLRKEIDGMIKERNRLMHDAWMTRTVGGDPSPQPLVRRRLRAHGSGADYEHVSYTPEDIEKLVDDAIRLTRIVSSAVWYQHDDHDGPDINLRFEVNGGKVLSKE